MKETSAQVLAVDLGERMAAVDPHPVKPDLGLLEPPIPSHHHENWSPQVTFYSTMLREMRALAEVGTQQHAVVLPKQTQNSLQSQQQGSPTHEFQ